MVTPQPSPPELALTVPDGIEEIVWEEKFCEVPLIAPAATLVFIALILFTPEAGLGSVVVHVPPEV